ncbi:MAG TPA: serine/threonine-protein kinase, partial [Terriglobales bacterium]
MIGQRLSHYRIVEQVGAGGMGVVYRAHDEQLDRSVAVKVLPVGALADEAARARFRKEALTLAKLDHPNIATIFEFGSQDGVDFLVTAYIPGITLDAKLAARGLPEEEVIALGLQLTQGLAAAHERGIIHRDLKPANLRLTPEGLLKILDFGLARVTEPESELALTASITQSQEITGTLPYMAPEQLRSERIDARSDVWAAGAVLYEMATGQRPFPETQGPVLISAILNGNPRPPKELNPKISTGLENVVLKALEKNPVHRYQTARDLRVDLERLAAGTGPAAKPRGRRRWLIAATVVVLALLLAIASYFTWRPGGLAGGARRSVAVLGFKNLAGKPEKAWMSTALSEMLTTELGVGGQLRTISGENVSRMKADLSLADSDSLAKENLTRVYQMLGSDIVVLGSYLDLGGRIRVDLRVQDTSAGETIATASEVGSEEQFFDLVKRLGESLREKCGAGELTAEQQAATRALEPANTEAARLYAEGLAKLRAFDAAGAKSLLQRAVRADPRHALAHSALAAAWSQLGYDEYAQVTSKTAYELSKGLPRNEALAIEARYREHNYEWDKAAEIYRSLWTFYPDDLEYGLRFANAQSSAGKGLDALVTVQSLRNLPRPLRDDPRIGMAEATAAESLGDYRREQAATARVIEGAGRHG